MTARADGPFLSGLPSSALAEEASGVSGPAFARLWHGFMTARATLGLALLLFQVALHELGLTAGNLLVWVCAAYFFAALAARLVLRPRPLGPRFGLIWLVTAGTDMAAFTVLQFLQGHVINLSPLYALPVLLAAVLGPLLTALGTAASVTLLLLVDAGWLARQAQIDAAPLYVQAALASIGSFAMAVLAHQLAARLASEERQARLHGLAARLQQQVNALVIESTSDGVLVVDAQGVVHAANPAAQQMLQADAQAPRAMPFSLREESAWQALEELVARSLRQRAIQQADLTITFASQGARRLRARTRLTLLPEAGGDDALCVVFLQDLRELEARLRADKLASMGRMSVAVAHEIRNPLAAISQANALLDEELSDPAQRQLTGLVRQNARRLEGIVEEVLDISRVPRRAADSQTPALDLHAVVSQTCDDWSAQGVQQAGRLLVDLGPGRPGVAFEAEHLRRVLINLLDNAARYASQAEGAIQVSTEHTSQSGVRLRVWSDGAPIEPSVERHLFEPFFSSESRSSGLGLFLCRELCEGHGAVIGYQRARRLVRGGEVEGNEFFVSLRHLARPAP